MEWTDRNFDHNILGSDDIVYKWILAIHQVSNNTNDGYNCKYLSSKCSQSLWKSPSGFVTSKFCFSMSMWFLGSDSSLGMGDLGAVGGVGCCWGYFGNKWVNTTHVTVCACCPLFSSFNIILLFSPHYSQHQKAISERGVCKWNIVWKGCFDQKPFVKRVAREGDIGLPTDRVVTAAKDSKPILIM